MFCPLFRFLSPQNHDVGGFVEGVWRKIFTSRNLGNSFSSLSLSKLFLRFGRDEWSQSGYAVSYETQKLATTLITLYHF